MDRVSAIIVAAGRGERFGSPKQLSLLKGKTVLDWSLEKFEAHEAVDEIILVLKEEQGKEKILAHYKKIVAVVQGGKERQDSVLNGFKMINPEKTGIVLVHDGVRPLVSQALISRVIEATFKKGAVIPGLLLEDTVKEVVGKEVIKTLERQELCRVQTPQGFSYSILKKALNKAQEEGYYGTDEASLVERTGERVYVVPGDPTNIKITVPGDLRAAEAFLDD
jgi:2-C-methyl-D-erythritol 4-phosphate cytidylyltransferase